MDRLGRVGDRDPCHQLVGVLDGPPGHVDHQPVGADPPQVHMVGAAAQLVPRLRYLLPGESAVPQRSQAEDLRLPQRSVAAWASAPYSAPIWSAASIRPEPSSSQKLRVRAS